MAFNRLLQRPIYLQVCDVLSERIANGEWTPGQSIPNEPELARDMGVSGGTVRKALELMEANHMLTRRQGRGTFIADPTTGALVDRFCNIRNADGQALGGNIEVLELTQDVAADAESDRLQIARQSLVWRLRRLRRDGRRVFMHERVLLPVDLFPELRADVPHRIVPLAHRRGLMLGPAVERVALGPASPEAAAGLAVAPGARVLLLDRLVHTTDGQPVEWRYAACHLGTAHYCAYLG